MTTSVKSLGIVTSLFALFALAAAGPVPRAMADGFIVVDDRSAEEIRRLPWPHPHPMPRPTPWRYHMPLQVKNHLVEAELTDSVGITRIDQSFHNPNNVQLEGTYIFPMADDVAVQKFSMMIGDKEVQAEVLDKDKARQIYEEIVSKMKDPALLEYVGSRMYKARVFPIPANGDVRIKLEYSQVITATNGLATYRYQLNTEKYSSAPISQVAIRARIKTRQPLATVFCPSHQASIDRKGTNEASVGYEASNVLPDKDFVVSYKTSNEDFAFVMLAHRQAGEEGYFMARIIPGEGARPRKVVAKDICFVIDTSGSMAGKKIQQAREALRYCLANLNADDRFNIVAFSTEARPYKETLISAKTENTESARQFAAELQSAGGTAINDALLAALKARGSSDEDKGRPYMIVFLTDGLPTIGETNIDRILENVKKANAGGVRLFVFGVGNDVNTKLLDKLAEDNHGSRDYVAENEDLELKLSNFYGTIANPVLSDLKLTFDSALGVHDTYPKVLPDLFKGGELVIFGRYANPGKGKVELAGRCGDEDLKRSWEESFAQTDAGQEYLPRLWATRKVGYLLDEIRLHGENKEVREEVVQLAKRFGIVTPYTSMLIMEEDQGRIARGEGDRIEGLTLHSRLAAARPQLVEDAKRGYSGRLFGLDEGDEAVAMSKESKRMTVAEKPHDMEGYFGGYARGSVGREPAAGRVASLGDAARYGYAAASQPAGQENEQVMRYIGSRTFYRDGEKWVDSRYKKELQTTMVKAFSKEYFELVAAHPDLGKCFALGTKVIVVIGDKAYETTE
jgi:Ca-activated chloride channel family protein